MLTTTQTPSLAPSPTPAVHGPRRRFRCTVHTRASAQAVWNVWLDVARWPTWDDPLEHARLDPPSTKVTPGARGTLKSRGAPASSFEIVALDEHGYVFSSPLPLGELRVARTLEATPDGCAVTHEVSFGGLGGWLLSWWLAPGFRRSLPRVMQALVRRAEELS